MKLIFQIKLILLVSFFTFQNLRSQTIVLNEVMSSNSSVLYDEFGDTPDWIEIFNNTETEKYLSDYFLSDNRTNLKKWMFPSLSIESNNFLLINASGKEINYQAATWETIFTKGDNCKFFLGTSEPPQDWKNNSFNDAIWQSGNTGIGYGDNDDQTQTSVVNSVYIRKSFVIDDTNEIAQILFNIDYDDGFVAYINGIEIARANLGNYGDSTPFDQPADQPIEARLFKDEQLDAYFLDSFSDYLVSGTNVLAIQINNYGTTSSDLTSIPFLTLGYKSQISNTNIAEEIKSLIPQIHANFKISNGTETIFLSNTEGAIIDSIKIPYLEANTSFGRKPDGGSEWNYFYEATPNSSNSNNGYSGQSKTPEINFTSGFYSSSINLQLENSVNGEKTYYTTDGSEPEQSSNILSENVTINKTTVLKVKSFTENFLPSITKTFSYFINVEKDLPIISLSTDPKNLWDYNEGIYTLGPNDAETQFPYFGANFWEDWKRTANFEFFNQNENVYLESPVDIKIFGGWSRGNAQKSLSIFPTNGNMLENVFFPDEDIDELNSIVLRNSGNDWESTMFRDGFLQDIGSPLNLDKLAFRPAVLYLNGEYWGIHNIREKINLNYIADHHDVKKSDIDLLELFGQVIDGDNESFFQMINFLETHNLSNNSYYEEIANQIDISNFIDYHLFQIFIVNVDWPGNNNKYWKPKIENGKWRWILFDTDFGFGIYNPNDYSHNTLQFATEENGPGWPNPPWSTFIFRKLLESEIFKNKFITRYADLGNTAFSPDVVKYKLEKAKSTIENEIDDHLNKWNKFSYSNWQATIEELSIFADFRLPFLNQYFIEEFGLGSMSMITLQNSDMHSGIIKINTLTINDADWKGRYFTETKINLEAVPNPGYRFAGWSGGINSAEENVEIDFDSPMSITANFETDENFGRIVINEINYNSYSNFDTKDWIELYNNSDEAIDLAGWQFTDEVDTNKFIFPTDAILKPNEYLIITRDSADFIALNGNDFNIVGNFNFGLSNSGELIRILDNKSVLIDSVRYDDKSPWAISADGNGNTLELINPDFNNGYYRNWSNSTNFGSPGKKNSNFSLTSVEENIQLPQRLSLSQNYPNPFNPNTIIEYAIPASLSGEISKVKLIVYDILGREIKTLVNTKKSIGNYKVSFDGSEFSSGIYFYQLTLDNNIITKKMMLIK